VTPWTVWEVCEAGRALGKPLQYRWCPTTSNGTIEIDVPPLTTEKEFAPDSVVVGEEVPCTRNALTGDHGRKIEKAEEIDGDLRREVGQEVCRTKAYEVSEIRRGENEWNRGPIKFRGDCVESYGST
jgi:hypothetical protein